MLLSAIFFTGISNAQKNYSYSVDLTNVKDDQLTVELITPEITKNEIIFYLPRIVPGTYMNSNYGMYVHELKAFDKAGKQLTVTKNDDNSWKIKDAKSLYRISYKVEDTWYSEIKNKVYPMCGTNFEEGKNFVINTPGLFGYFDGMKKTVFDISFTKPLNFYAATGLKPVSTSNVKDVFKCSNVDELYDSPIMFSLPDTATIKVGNTDVLIAIYSPKKLAHAKFIADHLEKLLMATKDYLGGKLPVDKYAFIYYLNGEQPRMSTTGAWEHSYSSFYSIPEQPENEAIDNWVDISSHEFFHIVTPLTISSREVKEFNFNETVLSKHLWLYEGSTEYYAHHVQVAGGLITPEKFLETLSQEIKYSRTYFNDSLSFTELSKESAGKWAEQYGNVYMKGALISACLDIYLLKLSGNQYGLKDLKHDLGVQYGKDKYFEDDELFDVIEKLTYPEIKDFLITYVQGGTPIPYEKYFGMAGIDYVPKESYREFTMGRIDLSNTPEGKVMIDTPNMNDFGRAMGYQKGDVFVSLNGKAITTDNLEKATNEFFASAKEGDIVTVIVNRKNAAGKTEPVTLTAHAVKVDKTREHLVRINNNATPEQIKLRNTWLNSKCSNGN